MTDPDELARFTWNSGELMLADDDAGLSYLTPTLGGEVLTMAFDPAEPRGPGGEWITLFHGTVESNIEGIQGKGLTAAKGNIGLASVAHTLTDTREHAENYARNRAAGWLTPKVVEYRIPRKDAGRYLYPGDAYDAEGRAKGYALRKSLPSKYIHAVHDVGGGSSSLDFSEMPPANTCPHCGCPQDSITGQIELAFNPAEPRDPHTGKWVLNSLNPTGSLFTSYKPEARARAPLGPNMTTLAETQGKHPDTPLRIYRGAPAGQQGIMPGDFITDNRQLAADYAGSGKVLSLDTTYGDVLDDRTEPGGGEYIYRPRTISSQL